MQIHSPRGGAEVTVNLGTAIPGITAQGSPPVRPWCFPPPGLSVWGLIGAQSPFMSGRWVASRADEDLSPDQSRPALTATMGPVLKLDGSPASPWLAVPAPAPWPAPRPGTAWDTPAIIVDGASHAHMCTHVVTHCTTQKGLFGGRTSPGH